MANSELGTWRDFYQPDLKTLTSDTREPVGEGDSIKKDPGPGGSVPGREGSTPPQKRGV